MIGWFPAPIIQSDASSVKLSWKQSCFQKQLLGLRYLWLESPCQYKKCAIYSIKNQLPATPFVTFWKFKEVKNMKSGRHKFSDKPVKIGKCL